MVYVKYVGRLGNNLFQYVFGRLLAERLGVGLSAKPIPGFFDGCNAMLDLPVKAKIFGEDIFWIKDQSELHGDIVLNGFYQRYDLLRAHKARIRSWFQDCCPLDRSGSNDLVVYVRRGDYVTSDTKYMAGRSLLPFCYYSLAIHRAIFNNIYICTDNPDDPFLRKFKKWSARIHHSATEIEDFCFMRNAKQLVLSQSSFCWWAAFLSDADKVYFPKPMTGYWSNEYPLANLTIDDEPRYILIKSPSYRKSFYDIMQVLKAREKMSGLNTIRMLRGQFTEMCNGPPELEGPYRGLTERIRSVDQKIFLQFFGGNTDLTPSYKRYS